MTLIEVMLALTILAVAVLAFSQALIATSRSTATTREMALAEQAVRQVVESMHAAEFAEVFALYDSSAANDPDGAGTAPGQDFDVPGLDALSGDGDGMVGEVVFPEGAPGVLREDLAQVELGMPRDLNGDGIDANDHSGDYQLLPVLVRVRWRGANGTAKLEVKTILASY